MMLSYLICLMGLVRVDLLLYATVDCISHTSIIGFSNLWIRPLKDSFNLSKAALYSTFFFYILLVSSLLSSISISSFSQQIKLWKWEGNYLRQVLIGSSSSVGQVRFQQQDRQNAKQESLLQMSSSMRLKIGCCFTNQQVRKLLYQMVSMFVRAGMSFLAKIPFPIFFVFLAQIYSCSMPVLYILLQLQWSPLLDKFNIAVQYQNIILIGYHSKKYGLFSWNFHILPLTSRSLLTYLFFFKNSCRIIKSINQYQHIQTKIFLSKCNYSILNVNIPNSILHFCSEILYQIVTIITFTKMGVMCVQSGRSNELRQQRIQQQKAQKAAQSIYARLVNEFISHYGFRANDQTRQFIEKCYNDNYQSKTILLTPKTIENNKQLLIERFQLALNKSYQTTSLTFVQVDEANRTLHYIWVVNVRSQKDPSRIIPIHYRCTAIFDEQNKFLNATYQQFMPKLNQPGPRPLGSMYTRNQGRQQIIPQQSMNM